GGPFVQYAIESFPVRILVLDTATPGSDEPSYCADRTAWLARQLKRDAKPTLIAMHHPPMREGVAWVAAQDPNWAAPIGELVTRVPHVKRIVAGHVHRSMLRTWAGVPVTTAPSTAHQVALTLATDAKPLLSHEAPGFQLHRWERDDFTTYTVAIPGSAQTFWP